MKVEDLKKFLMYAKKRTYASTLSIPKRFKNGGVEYVVKKGEWVYIDKYYGDLIDCGQEVVMWNGKVVWCMSYRGGMFDEYEELAKQCFGLLKKALKKMPKEFPARGPKDISDKNFMYKNRWTGNILGFTGEEKMFWKGKQVYFRNYLGGEARNRQL